MELAVILIAMAVGAFIKGVTGSGLPQIAIPVMATFIGVEPAVVIMAIPGVVTNTWLLVAFRHHRGEARDLPVLLATGIAGAVVGTWLLKSLDNQILSLVLAGVIILYVTVFLTHPHLSIPPGVTRFTSPVVGTVAGVLQGATGISGPVLITYLHSFRLRKETYVFSLTLLFQVNAVVQTFTLVTVGLFDERRFLYGLLALIPIMVMLRLGAVVAKRLSLKAFDHVVVALMIATALKLVYDGIVG